MPFFSVVICTYNRADVVGGAIRSVLAQTFDDIELLVVDDGSADDTPAVLAAFDDPRMRVIRRPNGGLSAARNTGIGAATGRYVIFLDDDDEASADWLAALAGAAEPDTGFLSCTCHFVTPDRRSESVAPSTPHTLYPDIRGVFLAGTFAVDRSVLSAVGGYAEEIRVSHQTELLLRVLPELRRRGLGAAFVDRPLVTIERREQRDRPMSQPADLLHGAEYLITRHGDLLRSTPATLANYHAVAGVSAVQLGHQGRARRHFLRAVRLHPTAPRHGARLAVSLVPPVARRAWRMPKPGAPA